MFKTDPKSLEELSFAFDERDISRFRHLLDLIKSNGMLTLDSKDFERIYEGLVSIEMLKLNGKVYAFDVEDTYAAIQGGDSGEGVELYLRQGNTLKDFAVNSDRAWVLKVDQVVPMLNEAKINTIYTGPIIDQFLNLPKESDPDDPIYREILSRDNIEEFECADIKVVTLDSLV